MIHAMKLGLRFALLIPIATLLGCAVSSTPSSTSPTPIPTPTGNWDNWQIQAGTAITSPPNTYPSFLGAIQIQGPQASGIFTTVEATGASTAEIYGGTYNSSTGNVILDTYGFGLGYTQPTAPYTLVPVAVIGGCVYPPTYTGPACGAIFGLSAVGVQIAPLTGTFAGTITDSAAPSVNGTGSLTLTQSSTPNTSGAFPLTGTVTFPTLGEWPVSGTVSGEAITLNYCSPAVIGPCITVAASTNPTATQITLTNLTWAETGPSYTFTGTLTRQ